MATISHDIHTLLAVSLLVPFVLGALFFLLVIARIAGRS